ncbi:MAG: hypothetical protein JWM53_429, partial [bacterium]|nr:hypothetical protein [bacterium]
EALEVANGAFAHSATLPRLLPLAACEEDRRPALRGIVRTSAPIAVDLLVDDDRLLLWHSPPVELEVTSAAGQVVRVVGCVRVAGPASPASAAVAARMRAAVDARLRVRGTAVTVTLRDGDEVELDARLRDEPVPAGYREPAVGKVARAEPGRPVVLVVTLAVDSRGHV